MTVADLPETIRKKPHTIEELMPGDKVLLPVPVSGRESWMQGWLQPWRYLGRTDAETLRFATRDTAGDTKNSPYPHIFDLHIKRSELQEARLGEDGMTHQDVRLKISGGEYVRHTWDQSNPHHRAIYTELNLLVDTQ